MGNRTLILATITAMVLSIIVPVGTSAIERVAKTGQTPVRHAESDGFQIATPSISSFRIYPSINGSTPLAWYPAYPYEDPDVYPIIGDKLKLTAVTRGYERWELVRLEYSLDGKNWYPLLKGTIRWHLGFRYIFTTVDNTHDGKVHVISIRGWFKMKFLGMDPETGQPYPTSRELVGPVVTNFRVLHTP